MPSSHCRWYFLLFQVFYVTAHCSGYCQTSVSRLCLLLYSVVSVVTYAKYNFELLKLSASHRRSEGHLPISSRNCSSSATYPQHSVLFFSFVCGPNGVACLPYITESLQYLCCFSSAAKLLLQAFDLTFTDVQHSACDFPAI